jgi:hypothetical protein
MLDVGCWMFESPNLDVGCWMFGNWKQCLVFGVWRWTRITWVLSAMGINEGRSPRSQIRREYLGSLEALVSSPAVLRCCSLRLRLQYLHLHLLRYIYTCATPTNATLLLVVWSLPLRLPQTSTAVVLPSLLLKL